jgi:polysaccharide biosynthesis/export protein
MVLVLGGTHAFAQVGSPAGALTPAKPPAPVDDYVVGPQDVLSVRIYGEEKMSGRIRIDTDGSFPFEYLGRVNAEGMTTAQIEAYLAKALGDGYLRNPQVSVEVVEYRSQSVFVTGEVRAPNKYSLPGNSTLMDLLTLAGSVTPNAGNWVQITHARKGAESAGPSASADYDIRVNLRDIQTGKAQNIKMKDGDTIFVPKAERVWVVGQVRNPQGVIYEEGMTVFEAIAAAGGITEKGSNSRIEIVRIENGQRRSLDAKQTDVLKPGDQVNVRTRRL